jgi:hypothetical protein
MATGIPTKKTKDKRIGAYVKETSLFQGARDNIQNPKISSAMQMEIRIA